MPPKPTLDKICWQWAETTEPDQVTIEHIRTAYRLNLPICKLAVCKRQCKGNPYCMNCIGEKIWFGKIDDSSWHDIEDPTDERREPGMFVGLKNLGATCYVNTFLQLWFHNETIRKGVYEWRENDEGERDDWQPDSVCSHLQVIFGLLELSTRAYIDPSNFIKHLGLDAGQQQDAQEFSNLFLSVLEQNLQLDVNPNNNGHSSNVIKDQFCGKYAYVTRCSNCSNSSERLSNFYELDLNIQGHKTLAGSLKLFLQEEKLDGDNQYMCSKCNGKQDATRAIELKSLPPVLNLQLLRFVFDLKTGSKKKLNSCIQFPDVLDMRPYLPNDPTAIYDLTAVLIHRGASAYSGHYVAHVKGKDSQSWFKFNDEQVEKIKGKNLQLGSEEDLESKQQKTTRTPKGHHASKNAYMLVYTKHKAKIGEDMKADIGMVESDIGEPSSGTVVGNELKGTVVGNELKGTEVKDSVKSETKEVTEAALDTVGARGDEGAIQQGTKETEIKQKLNNVANKTNSNTEPKESVPAVPVSAKALLPANVLKYIEKDNKKFESWILEMNEMREDSITKGQEKQETVKAIYQDLTYVKEDGDKYEWLPMSWFNKWLTDPATAPAIDVSGLMCMHEKVCPEKCLKMKCVSQRGSDQLFSLYGGEVRLKGDNSLCEKCVRNKCHLIRTKKRIAEDDKFVAAIMKTNFFEEPCYWIGKGSFRSWRRLAVESLEDTAQVQSDKKSTNSDDEENEESDGSNSNKNDSKEAIGEGKELIAEYAQNGTVELAGVDKKDEIEKNDKDKSDDTNEDSLDFNEDLLCEKHGGLDPDVNCRRLVPQSVWTRLKRYFPNCAEFPAESVSCEMCTAKIERENESKFMNKQLAYDQKNCLLDLFHDRKRPITLLPGSEVFALSTDFLETWRRFVRDPSKYERIVSCSNTLLLCEHGGYLYPPENENLKSDGKVTYISPIEWKIVQTHFETDSGVHLKSTIECDQIIVNIEPKVCDECLQVRLNEEAHELYDYDKGVLYVRKLSKSDNKANTISDTKDDKTDDPEFTGTPNTPVGKKRSSTSGPDANAEPAEKCMKLKPSDRIVRKSQRHRRARGEKEVVISSKSTLRDLKLELMKLFAVPPFDQNLYIDGILLDGNEKSLADLHVPSGSVVELIADEPQEDTCFLDDITKESGIPESGFKGTNLLSAQ